MSPTADAGPLLAGQQEVPPIVRVVVCYARTANPSAVGRRHLQRQRARLHAACTARGWRVLAWIEDLHQSSATLDRPGPHRALALLAGHQADALLATDATPLAVDAALTSQLVALAARQGWQLLTVTPTPRSTAAPAATVVDPSPSPSPSPGRGGARR